LRTIPQLCLKAEKNQQQINVKNFLVNFLENVIKKSAAIMRMEFGFLKASLWYFL
jgi:hypothetical protein